MLKRFKFIQGIGTFTHYDSKRNDTDFRKNTIVYANNGYGKSTLALILKSVNQNNPQRIIARKTLITQQTPIEQKIVMEFDEGRIVFENDAWKNNADILNSNILVFDQKYVYENLFVEKIDSDHKKNIHKIIIGEEGVKISQELTNAKDEVKRFKQNFDTEEKELQKKIRDTDRSDYLNIQTIDELSVIEQKEKIDRQILIIEEKNELTELANFPTISKLDWNFSPIEERLVLTIENIHEDIKKQIEDHINTHMKKKEAAYEFLREGLDQTVNVCPFCGQLLKESEDLIEAYHKYFDKKYNDSINKIDQLRDTWSQWDPSAEILSIRSVYEQGISRLHEIESRIELNLMNNLDEINFGELKEICLSAKKEIVELLTQKSSNLNRIVETQVIGKLRKSADETNKKIKSINEVFILAKKKTAEEIGLLDDSKKQELEIEKKRIFELQKRFSKDEIEWCDSYKRLENNYQESQNRCEELTNQLSEYSTEIIGKYQIGMNEILEELGVDFRIRNLSEQVDNRAKQPFVDFQFEINDMPVSTKDLDDAPCFKNTLSGGEKNTLSFAFFITSLKQMGDLSNTIVVFDDPLSSMDDNRRSITANIINDLAQQTKQMIVLTHKKDFLLLLYEKIGSRQVLSIRKDKANGSQIIPLDIDKEFKTEQQKIIENLYKYSEEDFCSVQDIQASVRICLENALKFKYFMHITHLAERQKTLGKLIHELRERGKIDEGLSEDLLKLNDFSCPQHHGRLTEDPMKNLTYTETVTYVKKAISVLEKI